MERPRPSQVLLLVPLVLAAAWLVERGRTARQQPGDVLRALHSAHGPSLPEARAAAAAARTESSAYDRETLYEYIDGAAEAYLARGFERCSVATYTFTAADGAAIEISAEVHRFAGAGGAREQMLAERPTASTPVAGLADTFADATTLVAVRGRDYLKLVALAEGAAAREPLAAVASAWSREQP